MKKYVSFISVASALCLFFLTAGNSLSADYKKIGNKTIHWNRYTIKASKGWFGSRGKTKYSLIYKSGNEYGAIILSNKASSLSERQYQQFLPAIHKKLAGNPGHSQVILERRTPYNVLGIENSPAVLFLAKGKRFFTFTPYINRHVYTLVAVSWHKNSKTLPGYMVDMLNNINLTLNNLKQRVAKEDTAITTRKPISPIRSSTASPSSTRPAPLSGKKVLQLHPAEVGDADGALKTIKNWWNIYGVKHPYRVAQVDLDGDGNKEVIVHVDEYHCHKKGTDTCTMTVLKFKKDKYWDSVTPSWLKARTVSMLPSTTHGWYDLAFDNDIFIFDGTSYIKKGK